MRRTCVLILAVALYGCTGTEIAAGVAAVAGAAAPFFGRDGKGQPQEPAGPPRRKLGARIDADPLGVVALALAFGVAYAVLTLGDRGRGSR